jgi:DNA-directed RNA polymerase specialized sigma24 family protein
MTSNLETAIALARAGLLIFPALVQKQPGRDIWSKRPALKNWREIASSDYEQLQKWWSWQPDALPGIELGRSGLIVIDTDRHGGADGIQNFDDLVSRHEPLPSHPIVETPAGRHHIFAQPSPRLGNRTGALPPGIDVRGAGGWVVAPGAVRSDLAAWRPLKGTPLLTDVYPHNIPVLPEWLDAMISDAGPSVLHSARTTTSRNEQKYAQAALERRSEELAQTVPGCRNSSLNTAAFAMGGMVARGWIEEDRVRRHLERACHENRLVTDDGLPSVLATLTSGLTAGAKTPHRDLSDITVKSAQRLLLKPVDLKDFLALDIPPRQFLLEELLQERSLTMIYSWRGLGKTWVSLALGLAIASGSSFLKWKATDARRVLHVCGEMPAEDLQARLKLLMSSEEIPAAGFFRILSADQHENGIPDLATQEGQSAIDQIIGDADVIVLDNISSLCRTGAENDADSWIQMQNWLLRLRREGRAVILVHHANKGRSQRGTSKREDVLDLVLNLREPPDEDPQAKTRFHLHFEKARSLAGPATQPFEVGLEAVGDHINWTWRDIDDVMTREILELHEAGLSVREIARQLQISPSKVHRRIDKQRRSTEA